MNAASEKSDGRIAELVRRAQEGDTAAFDEISTIYRRQIYQRCLRMVGNPADAEDLTQDTLLRMFRCIKQFQGNSAFGTWVTRITINLALMKLRRKEKYDVSLDELLEKDGNAFEANLGIIDRRQASTVDRIALKEVIALLCPSHQNMLYLRDVKGYGHHEIGEMLGISVASSKSKVMRARQVARRKLSSFWK